MTDSWQINRNAGGIGFAGLSGVIFKKGSLDYTTGGIDLPIKDFDVVAVLSVNAEGGGVSGYYKNKKLKLYKDGAEASGTLSDVTLVLIGQ